MKFGVCKSIKDLEKFNTSVVDYCEMSLGSICKMTDEEIEECIRLSEEKNIPILSANCFFPRDIKLCGSGFSCEAIKNYAEIALEKANRFGIKTVVLGSGGSRMIPEGADKDECMAQLAKAFTVAGDAAAKYDITIVIEPLNKVETNCINTVSEGAEMIRLVNHPNVKLLCDIYHFAKENEPMSDIIENGDILYHFHIANPDGRIYPKKTDEYDYSKVVSAMREIGYDGLISIEGKALDFDKDLIEGIDFLKEIFA